MRQAARNFAEKWAGQSGEKQLAQSFWQDFFREVIGVPDLMVAGIDFEHPVRTERGSIGFIDVLWGGVVLIEHKSAGKDLAAAMQQARGYLRVLPRDLSTPFIIVSDFARFRILDVVLGTEVEFALADLPDNLDRTIAVFADYNARATRYEVAVDRDAGEKMARLYKAFEAEGYTGHEVSVFLVRLLFLLFGDDTGMWRKPKAFEELVDGQPADGSTLGPVISGLFAHLNDPNPPANIPDGYKPFPYVNGGLFAESIRTFYFTKPMRDALLDASSYNWASISPAIFGAMFQTVKTKAERREFGEHYTSEANILKVIGPLFLDEFTSRMVKAWDSKNDLRKLRAEIGRKTFLDPACGSGNFLLVAYRRLRDLELKIITRLAELEGNVGAVGLEGTGDLAVVLSLGQFHGFEIDEWSSQIATVAMFLADRQANIAMEQIVGSSPDRFPLKETAHIHNVNALRVDWAQLVPMSDDTFIFGNPPFYGSTNLTSDQKSDQAVVWHGVRGFGDLDFVASWFLLAGKHLHKTSGRSALVSTNSITQGQQPPVLWGELYKFGVDIDFAHRTFAWSNAGGDEAAVHCVIIGFSANPKPRRRALWSYAHPKGAPVRVEVPRLNAYLLDADNLLIRARSSPLQPSTPLLDYGSKPTDAGLLSNIKPEEAARIRRADPVAAKYLRRVVGAHELINGDERYGLWLVGASPTDLYTSSELKDRVGKVRDFRLASPKPKTRADASRPAEWQEIRQPQGPYIAVPLVSSERRPYIPMGVLSDGEIANNLISAVPSASMFAFGVLSSRAFVIWAHAVSGRMKSDPRISNTITYNNFPFPDEGEGWERIASAAKGVLDARALFPTATLAALYDDLSMPSALRKAHADLDKAVLNAYGLRANTSEVGVLEMLFDRYKTLTEGLLAKSSKKTRTRRS
ncbi:DNA methyltransferase [Agrococcus sediminis]|uniref:DNA methyltransferase n=1 Tax=Agrococcus sediminis TaxID=2599924 RepID=UPI003445D64E